MAERLITINLRKYLVKQPRTKRARKASRYVRERIAHYTKINPENVKIGYDLNNLIFKYYSRKMVPLKVRVKIGTDTADVLPYTEGKAEAPKEEKKGKKPLLSITKKEKPEAQQPAKEAQKEGKEKAQQKPEAKKQEQKPGESSKQAK
ncbi:MAG: hypothetical protein LVQ95_05385 [Candidatus Micrarchaeales archaeon]|nr:hypothetical protein [Candidatus Micrarchaeales archaeon]